MYNNSYKITGSETGDQDKAIRITYASGRKIGTLEKSDKI